MDPEANLKEQLQIASRAVEGRTEHPEDFRRLSELVLALNEWVMKGGFLPGKWQRAAANAQRNVNPCLDAYGEAAE